MPNELQWLDYLEWCEVLKLRPQDAETLKNYTYYQSILRAKETQRI